MTRSGNGKHHEDMRIAQHPRGDHVPERQGEGEALRLGFFLLHFVFPCILEKPGQA